MLARDIATGADKGLLKSLVILVVPILNADGNEPHRQGPSNRAERAREWESAFAPMPMAMTSTAISSSWRRPEVRSLTRAINEWDPAVIVDMHTTNGSFHRYTLNMTGHEIQRPIQK